MNAEIVLVDNGSSDGTPAYVRARFPEVRLVPLDANHGFAGGSNVGAREARGEYVAFLNNDTVADPGWLRALRAGVDAASRSLLVTSRIVYMHDPSVIDSAGDGAVPLGRRVQAAARRPAETRPRRWKCSASAAPPA